MFQKRESRYRIWTSLTKENFHEAVFADYDYTKSMAKELSADEQYDYTKVLLSNHAEILHSDEEENLQPPPRSSKRLARERCCCLPNKRPPCSLIRAMHFSCCRLNWRNTADRSVAQNFCNMPFFVRRMQSHSCAVLLLWPVAVAVLLAVATGSIQSSARWQHQQQYHHEHHHQRQRNRIVETVSEL